MTKAKAARRVYLYDVEANVNVNVSVRTSVTGIFFPPLELRTSTAGVVC